MLLKNNKIKYMCVYIYTCVTRDHLMFTKNCVQKVKSIYLLLTLFSLPLFSYAEWHCFFFLVAWLLSLYHSPYLTTHWVLWLPLFSLLFILFPFTISWLTLLHLSDSSFDVGKKCWMCQVQINRSF